MDFIHAREFLANGQSIKVDCDTQCNVVLTDDTNFGYYQRGEDFTYYGGHYAYFPVIITPPHAGHWNVTIDLGGASAQIRYSIQKIG